MILLLMYMKENKLFCELSVIISQEVKFIILLINLPCSFGEKYKDAFEIPEGDVNLRTQCYRNGKPLGRVLVLPRATLLKRIK